VHHNLVALKLKPLQEYLGLSHAKLEKIVLKLRSVLHHIHNNLCRGLRPAHADRGAAAAAAVPTQHQRVSWS
jgi:hypothetical protein